MLLVMPNPEEVPLQTIAQELDGTPKLDVISGTVRVYLLTSGGETVLLAPTALVGDESVWRYIWEPESLAEGDYIIEYTLVDSEDLTSISIEDLAVVDTSGGGVGGAWDDLRAEHDVDGSMGEVMNEIWKVIYKMRFGDRYKSS